MNQVNVLDFKIITSLNEIKTNERCIQINTINPHSYCVAKNDKLFNISLLNSDFILPDGIGFVWAARILNGQKIKRITGSDLHRYLLDKLNIECGKVFYLGSTEFTLSLIEKKVKKEYPNIVFSSYSPPYKDEFSAIENAQILNRINNFKPDILFVGMTAPKQEKWSYVNKERIEAKIVASIGAVFDFYASTVKRPNYFWQSIGMEWLPRLVREPRRLWKRNLISTPCFLFEVFKTKILRVFKFKFR